MATTIKLKNSVTTTNAPSSLVQGEVAINITDKKVWVGNAATTPIQLLGAGSSASFGALTCTSLTNSGLTSGRVTYASTGGLLADSANLTFNGTTLTANTIGAFTLGGTISGGGNQINNIVIGASTPLAGAFTTLSASGVATFSAGTVSAPALTTTGDTNTGIFFPAADTIAFTEGGAEAMRIDSSGNVGIGTSSPTASRLHIAGYNGGTTYPIRMTSSNSGVEWTFETGGSAANSSFLAFRDMGNSAERMRIDSSGNVGIGTSSPSYRLHVAGGHQFLQSGYNQYYGSTSNFIGGDSGLGALFFGAGGGSQNYMSFATASSERMRITSGGDVGIGTSSPSARLHVSSPDGTAPLTLNTAGGSDSTRALNFNVAGDNYGKILVPSGSGGAMAFWTGGANAAAERMRITSGGEVYIAGTTDQGAYNLQVNGTGVWGAGAYVNGSDERIKDNIAPLDSGLDVVYKLNPVTYKYKENWSKDQSTQTGFIAQELLTALEGKNYVDGVVQQGGQYMSVAYQNIIPILTKAIQEQQKMIEELKQEVAALKAK